jgi:hypothetical protein
LTPPSTGGGGGTFTLTGIPEEWNGKYADAQGAQHDAEVHIVGSATEPTLISETAVLIENGTVTIPLWLVNEYEAISRYTDSETVAEFVVWVGKTAVLTESSYDPIAMVSFDNVTFSNGSATKAVSEGTVDTDVGGTTDSGPSGPPGSVEPPILLQLVQGTNEAVDRYFSFRTASQNETGWTYVGVKVFYRIYAAEAAMMSDITSIRSANIQYSTNGYITMIGKNYQELDTSLHPGHLAGPDGGSVTIRLFDEGEALPAGVKVTLGSTTTNRGVPYRRGLVNKGFHFFGADPVPVDGDTDTNITDSDGSKWYVNAYAVSAGQNTTTLAPVYSQLVELGYITITP